MRVSLLALANSVYYLVSWMYNFHCDIELRHDVDARHPW